MELAEQAYDQTDDRDRQALAQILCAIGQFRRDLGALEDARDAYAEAVARLEPTGDALIRAHALRHLGDLQRQLGDTGQALDLLNEALDIYRKTGTGHDLAAANTERILALVHHATGDHDTARTYWRSARSVYAALEISEGVAECDAWLAG